MLYDDAIPGSVPYLPGSQIPTLLFLPPLSVLAALLPSPFLHSTTISSSDRSTEGSSHSPKYDRGGECSLPPEFADGGWLILSGGELLPHACDTQEW